MTFALLSSVKLGTKDGATTSSINTTGAKLLAAVLGYNNGVTPTLTDSAGNTWVASTATSNGSTRSTRVYYCINPIVSATHTFTIGPASILGALVVSAWSADGAVSFDKEVGGHGSGDSVTVSGNSGSLTPANNNSLIVNGFSFQPVAVSATAGSGWSLIQCQDGLSGNYFGGGAFYQLQTTATTISSATITGTATGAGENTDRTLVFFEAAASSLNVSTPSAFEVHQRSGTTGSIQITGTHSGPTEDIEASFNGGAYQTIATAVPAGSFSGTLTGQAQGQGTLTVRKKTTTSASATVADVGIGDVFVDGGDSRDEGRGTNAQTWTHGSLKACMFKSGVWAQLADTPGGGTIWPKFATRFMASQNVPIGIIRRGTGGTDVAGSNNSWAKPNGDYSALVSAVTASTVSGVKAALFLLGPNAIVNSNNPAIALATYRTALDTLASNLAADLPGAPKLFVDVCGEVGTGSPPDRRTASDNIRGAIISAWTNNSAAIKGGPVLVDQDYADNVHPTTDAQLLQMGDRYWLAAEAAFYSGTRPRGPRVSSAQWNSGRNQLTVVFDQALKTGLTHATQAWIVNDVGGLGALTISSVAYHGSNPNALVLTTSAAATGAAGSTRLSFASGDDAVGRVIPLSTDITLPGGGTVNQPAEPTYSYAVAEFAATATTVTLTLTTDGTTPAASLSGLRWAFFDQPLPNNFVAPTAKGTGATTNGSGVFTVSITGTALLVGATGWLVVTDTDGTPTQSPMKGFAGPVTVS